MSNFGEQINQVINNIANKLGVAVEKLYPALIKQAYIDGFKSLVWLIISIIFFIMILKQVIKWFKNPEKRNQYSDYDGLFITKLVISLCILPIILIIIVHNLNVTLNGLLNPNWYIVEKIISQIK